MKKREEYLMKLYWTLWQSADFENDFAEDWNAVYRKLSNGNRYSIPMASRVDKETWQCIRAGTPLFLY